ncbi:MAG: HAMP domain-containing histidine kinase [Myxococcales bacterium]|nr:HAMP domain-containing histidine kinase [Myxococcales bacterium]
MTRIRPEVAAALAAGSLHELRNLLGSAASALYLVRKAEDEAARARSLDRAERNVRIAQDLVTRLFDVARGGEVETDTVAARRIVDDAMSGVVVSDGIDVRVRIEPEDLEVPVDPVLFPSVISNLVQNAVQACGSGGVVRVEASADAQGAATFVVEDDGPGLDESRLWSGETTKQGGAGLGLLLVRAIVEAHRAAVRFERCSPGSRFVISMRPSRRE